MGDPGWLLLLLGWLAEGPLFAEGGGDPACPCVDNPSWRAGAMDTPTGTLLSRIGTMSASTSYPGDYGLGLCATHSAGDGTPRSGSPSCIDGTGAALAHRPAWCDDEWC